MEKILVPFDGSPTSEHAAEKAVEVARKYGSKLTFITVLEAVGVHGAGGSASARVFRPEIYLSELKEERTGLMKELVEKLDLAGIDYDTKLVVGEPYEEIIDTAEEENYDLIIMGRRGFSKIKRFFLGSVSHRVISGAPCPVLIINEKDEA